MTKKDREARKARAAQLTAALESAFEDGAAIAARLASTNDELASVDAVRAALDGEFDEVDAAAVFAAIRAPAARSSASSAEAAPVAVAKPVGLSAGKLGTIFSKAREDKAKGAFLDTLTPEMVVWAHDLFGDAGGGPQCMICHHVTTNRVWKCQRTGCNVELCGSCAFKWKRAL